MRAVATLLSMLVLLFGASPAVAQETGDADPVVTCVRISSDVELDDLAPLTLGRLLIAGEATFEVLDAGACDAVVSPEPTPTPTPASAPGPTNSPDPAAYVGFVAHGAGAVVELAGLARRNEAARGLDGLDRAAAELKRWARRQIRWLDRHPPAACYASAHSQWRDGAVQVRDGARAVRRAVRTLRPGPMRRAVRQLTAGSAKLTGVNLERVARACSGVEQET